MVMMVIVMVVAVAVAVACQCWWHFPVLHIESCILFSNSTLLEIVHIYNIMAGFFLIFFLGDYVAILTGFCPFLCYFLIYFMLFLYIIPEYMTSLSVHLFFVDNNFLVSLATFLCSVDLFFYPHHKLLYLSFGLPYYGIREGTQK